MFTRSFKTLGSAFAALALLLLAATSAFAAAGSPNDAVQTLVDPLATPGTFAGCNALTGDLSNCPITDRLRTRLEHPIVNVETGNLVSRSQQPPSALDVAQIKITADATTANVPTRWTYGTAVTEITFVVVKQGDGWLVDDSFCPNMPATSIYNTPTGPCPIASSTSTGTPGMPNTGNGDSFNLTLSLALVGLLAAALGTIMLRRARTNA